MTLSSEWIVALGALISAFVGLLTYRNSARKDAVTLLQNEAARAHARLEKIEAERNALADRVESLEAERDGYKAQSDDRDRVVVNQESQLAKLKSELDQIRAKMPPLYEHLDLLGRQTNRLMLENGDLQAQNLNLRTQLQARDEEIGRLHEQLMRVEQQR